MRILTVSAFFEGHGGGVEVVAGSLARALARSGHEARWAAASFDNLASDECVEAIPLAAIDPLERLTGLPLPLLRKAGRQLLEDEVRKADALIVHDALYASSLLAARLARIYQKPWLLMQHIGAIPYTSPILRTAMAAANRLVTRPLLAQASQVVFISELVRRHFADVSFCRVPLVIFNGVDAATFRPPEPGESRSSRLGFKLHLDRPQLLFVGRFVEKKGLSTLRALASARPEWDLVMVGDGPIDPGRWNLPNVVLLGRRNRADLAQLYRAATALVLPSVGEGFPLVIQEAMASGLPVLCGLDSANADSGAARFLHGLPVEPSDPSGTASRFAQALSQLEKGPDPVMAAYARRTFDWDANARRVGEELQALKREDQALLRPSRTQSSPRNTAVR